MDIDKRLIYGDSFTIGIVWDTYDTDRITEIVYSVGSQEVGRLADVELIGLAWAIKVPSSDTIRFSGAYPIIIELTDSVFGVRKHNCGTVLFERAGSGYNSGAVDDGVNYLINLNPFTLLTEVSPEVFEAFGLDYEKVTITPAMLNGSNQYRHEHNKGTAVFEITMRDPNGLEQRLINYPDMTTSVTRLNIAVIQFAKPITINTTWTMLIKYYH